MASKKKPTLSLSPRELRDGGWFYEMRRGLCVLQRKDGVTTQTMIPWRLVIRARENYYRVTSK